MSSKATADRENEHINLDDPEHIDYWTKSFGITAETLSLLVEQYAGLALRSDFISASKLSFSPRVSARRLIHAGAHRDGASNYR